MDSRPLLSVVLSFRNEEEVIPLLIERLRNVLAKLELRYELIFVNDDSTDRSLAVLLAQRQADPAIKIITMSRRMGVSECVLAGFAHARGDAVVYLDADLQDPPEVIEEMVAKWQDGADVVYTVRLRRQGESKLKLLLTALAYRAINRISSVRLPLDAGDFKLLSRRVLDILLQLREQRPYLRGMVTWLGFRQVPVYYVRQVRGAGDTHFSLWRSTGPWKMLILGLTSYSLLPVLMSLLVGTALLASSPMLLAVLLAGECWGQWVTSAWWLAWAVYLATALQLFFLGWASLYIGRIYEEVRQRPAYIIKETVGFDA